MGGITPPYKHHPYHAFSIHSLVEITTSTDRTTRQGVGSAISYQIQRIGRDEDSLSSCKNNTRDFPEQESGRRMVLDIKREQEQGEDHRRR